VSPVSTVPLANAASVGGGVTLDAEIRTARRLIDTGALGEVAGLELAFQRDVGPLRPGWRD
jgi:hypothetical protein